MEKASNHRAVNGGIWRVNSVTPTENPHGHAVLCPPGGGLFTTHLLYPLLAFLVVAGLIEHFHWDLALADFLYRLEGDHWALKKHFLTATVVHEYGRHLVQLLVFLAVGLIIRNWRLGRKRQLAAGLYLLACFAITTLTVSLLRHFTHVSCPWDLLRYGGDVPYVSIFARLPPGTEAGACFPAGHASSGYAWVALYYYFRVVSPRYRWYGLAFGLILGLTFDIAQQLRGAHFVSHGLWTLGIAWCVATGAYLLTLGKKKFVPAG